MSDDMKEMHDPEMSYRRGYQQGAHEVFEVVRRRLSASESAIIDEWINSDLLQWRLAAISGESRRDGTRITDDCAPPIKRLSQIRAKA
jgi:hypothetical protein